jgi:two-component sensor histidine kinase
MSLIHEKMYKTKDLKTVNIAEYITDLSNSLIQTYQIGQQIELDVNVEVNSFKADTLTPLGLIINEIISNALKYAFEEDKEGKIFVSIRRLQDEKYEMIIGDDGIGMPHANLENTGDSFGTELIGALTEQLNGSIRLLERDKGTVYEVIFEDVED